MKIRKERLHSDMKITYKDKSMGFVYQPGSAVAQNPPPVGHVVSVTPLKQPAKGCLSCGRFGHRSNVDPHCPNYEGDNEKAAAIEVNDDLEELPMGD